MSVEAGTVLPSVTVRLTRATAVAYAGASGDLNPIHYSDRAARAMGLPGVIVHGMWTMGAALRVVTDWCRDPGRVRSYSLRFTRPIPLPDDDEGVEVTFAGRVVEVDKGMALVQIDATVGEEKVLGQVKVQVTV